MCELNFNYLTIQLLVEFDYDAMDGDLEIYKAIIKGTGEDFTQLLNEYAFCEFEEKFLEYLKELRDEAELEHQISVSQDIMYRRIA